MFDIAWSEFLVVAVVALIVVGPRDLPALLRNVGKMVASLRKMAGEFQSQFNEAMREAELDDLKNEVTGLKDAASKMVGASPFQIARDEIKNALSDVTKPAPSALAGSSATSEPAAPSALAPAPDPAPTEDPPAPSEADFAAQRRKQAAATEKAPEAAPKARRAVAEKPAPAKPKAAKPKSANPKTSKAAKSLNGGAHPSPEQGEGSVAPKDPTKPGTAA